MKNFKSHFKFNKQEQSGIFFLLVIIIILQGAFFYIKLSPFDKADKKIAVNAFEQRKIDSLKKLSQLKDKVKLYPFNPNFITDYKGYTLGMSVEEIDRLHSFRSLNKYVNSKEEFQKITQVSDSLLAVIAPYFKFPDWVTNKKQTTNTSLKKSNKSISLKDINQATAKDLKAINGIGDKLSARILKFRDRLGGFLVNEQLYDVYGLEPLVVERILMKFNVISPPEIEKININTASAQEIGSLVYISYNIAAKIVKLRELEGPINSFEELTKIEDFPSEKLDRIALYLSL